MPPLTDRQQAIYDFILAFRQKNRCSPSIPEIQKEFGIRSPNGVAGHLNALEAKGMIVRSTRGSRQIDIPDEASAPVDSVHQLPVLGAIPAGLPQAMESAAVPDRAGIDEALLGFRPRAGTFVLEVRGESMRDAGILNGDMVVIEPNANPRSGQIVAALIDGESTLKRLVRVGSRTFLKAENPDYPELDPISLLEIQGVVRTVIRKLT